MRITNKMLSNTFMSDMRSNLENLKRIQEQMTSGKEIRKPSDDPFKVARSMQMHTDINTNKQYKQNITDTINWLDTTDTALGQMGNVLQRARELLISSGNGAYSKNERLAIKDEINAKVGEIAQVLNTNFDGAYIFGGTRGTTKPVDTIGGVDYDNAAKINCSMWSSGDITFKYKDKDNNDKTLTINLTSSGENNATNVANEINKQIDESDLKGRLKIVPNISDNSLMLVTEEDNIECTLNSKVYENGNVDLKLSNGKNKTIEIGNKKITINKDENIDSVIKKLEEEIASSDTLKGKVKVEKAPGNNVKILSTDGSLAIKFDEDSSDATAAKAITLTEIANPTQVKTTTKVSMTSLENTQLVYNKKGGGFLQDIKDENSDDGMQYNQIGSKLKVQIAQGVVMDYNVTARDVLEFKNEKGDLKDLRDIFNKITNHLDGKDDAGLEISDDAVKELVKSDLQNITDSITNLLKIRSEVGAKQNRMDSAKDKNTDATFNMTEILSKNEDIDITEKTMEFAVMQTVYVASLQTSARVLQPSLMDYLR